MNIMQRLLLIVLSAAVPVGVLQALSVRQERQAGERDVAEVAVGIAGRAAAEQRRIVEGARQLLTAMSQLPSVREGDATHCSLIAQRLQSQFPVYTAIGVASPAGRIWCSSAKPGTNLADRPYFKAALATRKFGTGGYIVGRVSGRRTLNFSLPFLDADGEVAGVLIAGLDLDRLAVDLAKAQLPRGSSLAIFGPDRRLLVDLPLGATPGAPLPAGFRAAFQARRPGTMETSWLDGSDRLVAFVPPAADPDMPFLIATGIDRAEALAGVEANARHATIVLLIVVAAALLFAWWFAAHYVRRPVQRLAGAVRAWRDGDATARVGRVDPGSEFDDLAQAFDALADTVVERQRLLRDALESTTDIVVAIAPDWQISFVNERLRARIGERDVTGQTVWDAFPEIVDSPVADALLTAMAERRPITLTFEHHGLSGHFETNAFPARDGGLILFSRDVTEQFRAQEALRRLALNDPLTDLPNRTQAMEIAREKAAEGRLSAVLLLDLDNFKHVNDSLGHPAGDEMLREVARRLSTSLGDEGIVARLGGDEFVALLFEASPTRSIELGRQLLGELEQEPFWVRGRSQQTTCSCGLVLVDGTGAPDIEELMAHADIALYRAKEAGGGACCTYSAADGDAYQARRRLEEEVARAATSGQFELYYQPQVRLDDGALVGAEALLRWRHPQRGVLPPVAFIDVLESSRHAAAVGGWIIDEACRHAAFWWRRGQRLRVSVNLFPQQVKSGDLPTVVQCALRRYGLPPEALELELTENIALAADPMVKACLLTLRMLGIRLAFDDFGTGFASLTTLKDLPVNRLKIDRGFVAQLPDNGHDRAIVEAVLALARTLDLDVVAEGVETIEQEAYLKSRGCQAAQGYRYARPMPARDFGAYVLAVDQDAAVG